jgi:hypothetical protein
MVTWSPYCGLIALIFWSALFDDSLTRSHVNHMFFLLTQKVLGMKIGVLNWSINVEFCVFIFS